MKLFKSIFLITIISGIIFSCNTNTEEKNGYSTITGVFDVPGLEEVSLFKIEHGKEFLVGTSKVNENKEFGFTVKSTKEGFFMVGDKYRNGLVYVKADQDFKVKYDVNGYQLLKSPDQENDILYKFQQEIDTLKVFEFYSKPITTFEDFFPFYETFIPKMKKHHDNVISKNERFNELMNAYIDLKIQDVAFNFVSTPRVKHPSEDDFPSFYTDFMSDNTVKSESILDLPRGIRTLFGYQAFKYSHTGADKKNKNYYTEMFSDIDSGKLRGYLSLEFIKKFKSYNQSYINFIEPKRKDIALSDYVQAEVDKYELTIKSTDPGAQGYPFTYKDINGKDVSFSDFKGKVVYIDVWATWCAPCKVQIPYLKKLEKELHGKDIQFVSLSVDKPKMHDKWKKFIEKEELTGVQLFSDNAFDTRIAKDYKITGIPRFLLFDKEGKIVDADAKRPSDPELKRQLLSLLK